MSNVGSPFVNGKANKDTKPLPTPPMQKPVLTTGITVMSRRRPFCSLEFFSGYGMISQRFAMRGWKTMWFDTTHDEDLWIFVLNTLKVSQILSTLRLVVWAMIPSSVRTKCHLFRPHFPELVLALTLFLPIIMSTTEDKNSARLIAKMGYVIDWIRKKTSTLSLL
jgi:hypothetical protein